MRKPTNKRPGSRSGEKTAKGDKKHYRPFVDKPKKQGERPFSGKREKEGDFEKKPRRSFADKDERPSLKKEPGAEERSGRASGDPAKRLPGRGFRDRDKDSKFGDKPRKTTDRESRPYKSKRDFASGDRGDRKIADKDVRPPRKKEFGTGARRSRSSGDSAERPSGRGFRDRDKDSKFGDKPRKAEDREARPYKGTRDFVPGEKSDRKFEGRKPSGRFSGNRASGGSAKPRALYSDRGDDRKFKKEKEEEEPLRRVKFDDFEEGKAFSEPRGKAFPKGKKPFKKPAPVAKQQGGDGLIRLNKYLSNAGVASRREADTLIQSGVVKVNGVVVDQLGSKIKPDDKVTYADAAVKSERKVYLLLNKPKDYITTVDDPQERKTVMELVAKSCRERIYPVGRLDRNTTGLLLFTNDGELTTKLMHPKFRIKKVYHVSLNKGLKPDDFKALTEGIELEDGPIKADDLAFVGEGKKEVGIEIHSGRNRIVRRIFEHLGYDVLKLDRVTFAGLTKKDLPRGKCRFLTAKEVAFLQMIG